MIDEGYVKFRTNWSVGPPPEDIDDLVKTRNHLHALGLVGEYPDIKIGYGNVSQRRTDGFGFVISGSATGHIALATTAQYCLVQAFDIEENSVTCTGPVTASSESLTHAMLYACDPQIGAVLHVHHRLFWEHLLQTLPSTAPDVPYGTPEMAREMSRLLNTTKLRQHKILGMAGHAEGIIAFGKDVEEASNILLQRFTKFQQRTNVENKNSKPKKKT
jgi:L-ribulose-5-phosphate 4-epimerase